MNFNSKSPFEKQSPFSSQSSSPFDAQSMFTDKTSIKNKSFDKKSSFDSYNSFDKKPSKEAVDLSKYEDMSGHTESRKVRKFFYFAIPVVVLEIIAILCISIYLIILPKNFCTISTNYKNAVVYVNGKETDKFRFQQPKESVDRYYYGVDISIKIQDEGTYQVSFYLHSDDYQVTAETSAVRQDNTYYLQVNGGETTSLVSAITLKSDSKSKDFDVKMQINVSKL